MARTKTLKSIASHCQQCRRRAFLCDGKMCDTYVCGEGAKCDNQFVKAQRDTKRYHFCKECAKSKMVMGNDRRVACRAAVAFPVTKAQPGLNQYTKFECYTKELYLSDDDEEEGLEDLLNADATQKPDSQEDIDSDEEEPHYCCVKNCIKNATDFESSYCDEHESKLCFYCMTEGGAEGSAAVTDLKCFDTKRCTAPECDNNFCKSHGNSTVFDICGDCWSAMTPEEQKEAHKNADKVNQASLPPPTPVVVEKKKEEDDDLICTGATAPPPPTKCYVCSKPATYAVSDSDGDFLCDEHLKHACSSCLERWSKEGSEYRKYWIVNKDNKECRGCLDTICPNHSDFEDKLCHVCGDWKSVIASSKRKREEETKPIENSETQGRAEFDYKEEERIEPSQQEPNFKWSKEKEEEEVFECDLRGVTGYKRVKITLPNGSCVTLKL